MELIDQIKIPPNGFVRLVDVMGNDQAVVQAARVSYGDGTKTVSEDRGLIRYLMRHRHTSPFEQVQVKFHMKLPIFVARQFIRHRTASVNELSGRYSELPEDCYVPEFAYKQSTSNKQGSDGFLFHADYPSPSNPDNKSWEDEFVATQKVAFNQYKQFLNFGMSREQARINLPLATYTEWYWCQDLHNLFHLLKLRMSPHAQDEIRWYANAMWSLVKTYFPLCCEAFEDYVLNAITLSKEEMRAIATNVNIEPLLYADKPLLENKRENQELRDKLQRIYDAKFSKN